jgi:adenylate cyclase
MPAAAPASNAVLGTVVFTDLVGFTEYCALRGDDEAVRLLALQERLVRDALPASARIVKELGDGLLVWFEHACDALEAALALQRRFEEESVDADFPLWVRIGMHSGRQTRRGDDLVGHDVNVAARVVDVAGPGEVLLSEATLSQIDQPPPDVTYEELGPVMMKGIPAPVRLYRAMAAE